jgi:nucleoside-triphosphatase
MKKRILLLTGTPGVGKTSVLLRVTESLKVQGYTVGGMVSREVRSGAGRLGFDISDLTTGKKGWLARVGQKQGPHVGKYTVNLQDIKYIGVEAIATAVANSDVVAIDEIGPMELCSPEFKEAVKRAVESPKLVVGVVHWRSSDSLITEMKTRSDVEVHLVTHENRGNLGELVSGEALRFLQGSS